MVKLTRKQREAIFKIHQRDFPSRITPTRSHAGTPCPHCGQWSGTTYKHTSITYRRLRAKVVGMFGEYGEKGGPVMLPWAGMWLGIEPDGHTHS